MAALISRLRTEPQLQVHSRSCNVSSLLIVPQWLQVFDDGSKRPIFKMFLPDHSALYCSIVTNIPQPTSFIDCASLWFFTMPDIFKSSIAMLSWLLISCVESLFKKSLRWLDTFSCIIANLCFVRLPLCFENFFCTNFNRAKDFFKNLGLSISKPFDVTKNDFIPKSIPIVLFSVIFFLICSFDFVSTNTETKYFPVGVLLIVACLVSPLNLRCKIISIPFFLNLGMINLLFSKSTITFCGILKDCLAVFFLKLGKSPCPLKNRVKALSKCVIDCCKDCELISLNHSHSSFNSGNCFIKSKQLKLTRCPAYAVCFVSRAKLYTNRQEPICLLINSACSTVGYIRYLYAFSISKTNIQNLYKKQLYLKLLTKFVSDLEVAYIPQAKAMWVLRSVR